MSGSLSVQDAGGLVTFAVFGEAETVESVDMVEQGADVRGVLADDDGRVHEVFRCG
jgi:hypothetical protein